MTNAPTRRQIQRAILRDPASTAGYFNDINATFAEFAPADLVKMMRRADVLRALDHTKSRELASAYHMLQGRLERRFVAPRSDAVREVDVDGHRLRFLSGAGPGRYFFSVVMPEGHIHEIGLLRFMARNVRPGQILVDVGAHIGFVSCFAASFGATVLALEMQPALVPAIMSNAILNDLWRVHPIHAAAGGSAGLVQTMRVAASPGHMAMSERVDAAASSPGSLNHDIIPRVRLDDLKIWDNGVPHWIKIDVEGAEGLVLAGATDLIGRAESRFLVELHSHRYASFRSRAQDILDLFDPRRWRFGVIRDDGTVDRMTVVDFLAHDSQVDDTMMLFEPLET